VRCLFTLYFKNHWCSLTTTVEQMTICKRGKNHIRSEFHFSLITCKNFYDPILLLREEFVPIKLVAPRHYLMKYIYCTRIQELTVMYTLCVFVVWILCEFPRFYSWFMICSDGVLLSFILL
jgi:hypothetical protein